MRISYILSVAVLALAPLPAFADEGHGHGRQPMHYDGHAAAMGMPGDAKARGIRTVNVVMGDDMRFKPAQISIAKGQTVRFVVKNNGELKHEFVLGTETELSEHAAVMEKFPEMEHDDPNAVSVEPGKTAEFLWTFAKPGTWNVGFGCLIPGHYDAGMKGKISVR
mgnify:CR=1 FL=1